MKYGFGVDLGGTTVKIAYFDENGTMIAKWEIPTVTEDGGKKILPDIAASIRQFIEQKTIDPATIIGVGIGVPGPVSSKGVVNKCVNLGWGVFNIIHPLSEKSQWVDGKFVSARKFCQNTKIGVAKSAASW